MSQTVTRHSRVLASAGTARFLFAVSFFLLFAASTLARNFGKYHALQDGDFYVYFFAGELVHEHPHGNLYSGATEHNPQLRPAPADGELSRAAQAGGHPGIEFYLYPPLLADLLAPLANAKPVLVANLWRALNLCSVLLSAILLARLLKIHLLTAEFAVLTLGAYNFFPVTESLYTGQITLLLLLLWTIGIAAFAEQRVILSAMVLALATVLKVNPVFLIPLFLLWRERKWIVTYSISVAALAVFMVFINGSENLLTYARVVSAMGAGAPTATNRCIASLIAWLYYGHFLYDVGADSWLPSPTPILSALIRGATIGFYLMVLVILWRRWRTPSLADKVHLMSLFALLACVLSPITWRHGYAIALIPLANLWVQALRNRLHGIRPLLLAFTTVATGTIFIDIAIQIHLPALVKIALAATWTVSSMVLTLNVLLGPRPSSIPTSRSTHLPRISSQRRSTPTRISVGQRLVTILISV